jgi:hypothetical protein
MIFASRKRAPKACARRYLSVSIRKRFGLGYPRLDLLEQACFVVGYDFRHFPLIAAGWRRDMVYTHFRQLYVYSPLLDVNNHHSVKVDDKTPLAIVQVIKLFILIQNILSRSAFAA